MSAAACRSITARRRARGTSAAISARSAFHCRICNIAAPAGGLDSHHLVARDRFGDDVPANIIGLCRDCHRGVELREPAHCRLLLTRLADAEYAYMVERGGEDYAERVYGVEYER